MGVGRWQWGFGGGMNDTLQVSWCVCCIPDLPTYLIADLAPLLCNCKVLTLYFVLMVFSLCTTHCTYMWRDCTYVQYDLTGFLIYFIIVTCTKVQ